MHNGNEPTRVPLKTTQQFTKRAAARLSWRCHRNRGVLFVARQVARVTGFHTISQRVSLLPGSHGTCNDWTGMLHGNANRGIHLPPQQVGFHRRRWPVRQLCHAIFVGEDRKSHLGGESLSDREICSGHSPRVWRSTGHQDRFVQMLVLGLWAGGVRSRATWPHLRKLIATFRLRLLPHVSPGGTHLLGADWPRLHESHRPLPERHGPWGPPTTLRSSVGEAACAATQAASSACRWDLRVQQHRESVCTFGIRTRVCNALIPAFATPHRTVRPTATHLNAMPPKDIPAPLRLDVHKYERRTHKHERSPHAR